MNSFTKLITLSLGTLVVALALVGPAAADVLISEIYTRTQTQQQADQIAAKINMGKVAGWQTAFVDYDAATRTYIVTAVRTGGSTPSTEMSQVETERSSSPEQHSYSLFNPR